MLIMLGDRGAPLENYPLGLHFGSRGRRPPSSRTLPARTFKPVPSLLCGIRI
jgi:hypothetical protein